MSTLNSYFIPYKNGGGTIVDWDFTNPIHCFNWSKTGNGYAEYNVLYAPKKYKRISMHRFLLGFPKEVDHINGKRNDNRISNLRSVTRRQNHQNNHYHRSGKLVGATFDKRKNKWKAACHINGHNKHIGHYDTEIEAHLAYVMYTRGL